MKNYIKPILDVKKIEIFPVLSDSSSNNTITDGGTNSSWDKGIIEDFGG